MLKLTIAILAAILLTACGGPAKRTEKQQVVAGTNYRFVCKAKTVTPNPETYRAEVIVFKPLPGQGEAKITKITRL